MSFRMDGQWLITCIVAWLTPVKLDFISGLWMNKNHHNLASFGVLKPEPRGAFQHAACYRIHTINNKVHLNVSVTTITDAVNLPFPLFSA